MKRFELSTAARQMVPVTSQAQQAVEEAGLLRGLCVVYCPHTTAGITINENADPDVAEDLLLALEKAFPNLSAFRHLEGNSSAHARASVVGSSATIPVEDGKLMLGRWQGVFFCEFDGPRSRTFYVQTVAAE